jgi:hypothetical protein
MRMAPLVAYGCLVLPLLLLRASACAGNGFLVKVLRRFPLGVGGTGLPQQADLTTNRSA